MARNLFDAFREGVLHPDFEVGGEDDLASSGSESEYLPSPFSESESSERDSEQEDQPVGNDDVFEGKDATRWNRHPPPIGRVAARNLLRGPVQKVVHADHIFYETEMFTLYINEEVVSMITTFTNLEGARSFTKWEPTTNQEIWALIGALMTIGHMKQTMSDTTTLWSKEYGIPILRSAMSGRRFKDLMAVIRFDDKSSRAPRRAQDKFAAIWEVFSIVNSKLLHHYIPGVNLTVDEQLMPYRGRCSFIQYLPLKPDKYGIKFFWIVDSSNYYPLKCIPYLGKEERYVRVGLAKDITMELCRPFFGSNRNVTMDNYYTDYALSHELLANGLTMVGTVKQNKRFLPPEITQKKARPQHDSLFGFQKKATIVTYQCKKTNHVTLLSTMHDDAAVDDTPKRKPEMVLYYNRTKGGVDKMDQLAHTYTVKRRTKRWPLVVFMNLLDIAAIAAYTAWTVKFPAWNVKDSSR